MYLLKSVRSKLILVFFVIFFCGIVSVYLATNSLFRDQAALNAQNAVSLAQTSYENAIKTDVAKMSATLEALLINEGFRTAFMKRDREGLYRLTAPFLEHVKQQFQITNLNFIEPEPASRIFLRVHQPALFGDELKRPVFLKAVASKQMSYGLDVGKAGFALRVVHPYYDAIGGLIGYMEVGELVNHIFEQLHNQGGDDLGLLIQKRYLQEDEWASSTKVLGLRNNWADFKDVVLISRTTLDESLIDFSENLEQISAGKVLGLVHKDGRTYARGIFPISDAVGAKVGAIYVLHDISSLYDNTMAMQRRILVAIILLASLMLLLLILAVNAGIRALQREASLQLANHALQKSEEQMHDQLVQSEKLAALGEVTASIAHEMKQPLNAMKIICQALLRDIKKGRLQEEDVKKGFDNVVTQVNRSAELIDHMRTFTRKTVGEVHAQFDVNTCVTAVGRFFSMQLRENSITLEQQLTSGLPPVTHDPNRIEQVVLNLVTNARHALADIDRPQKTVKVLTYAAEASESPLGQQSVVIEVADNGPGVPIELQQKIFESFFTTKEAGKGTGLGLSISARIVKEGGGDLVLVSAPGEGASFKVYLPISSPQGE